MNLEGFVQEHRLAYELSKSLLDCYTEVKSRLLVKLPSTCTRRKPHPQTGHITQDIVLLHSIA
jgi:hypothetical protein